MKVLWKNNEFAIAEIDRNNWSIGKLATVKDKDGEPKEILQQQTYYNSRKRAVKSMCERVADDQCQDLNDWLVKFDEAMIYFDHIAKGWEV